MREIRVLGLNGGPQLSEAERRPDLLQRSSADLRLRIADRAWIRGQGANVEVAGDLRIEKEPGEEPRYSGALRAVRGSYLLHGRSFKLQQGTAAFTGSSELDPQIQLVALYRVREIAIVAVLSGWLSAPQIELSSNPALSENDILAYLVFGRPTQELSGGESASLQATAASSS